MQSYVFFKESAGRRCVARQRGKRRASRSRRMASIAVDLRFHALGVPFFIDTTTPDGHALQNLFIAQDTGGAIRGPARADIFFGFGAGAADLAGEMKSTGPSLSSCSPKAVAARFAP